MEREGKVPMWKDDRFTGYSINHLRKDMTSGIVVGIVAIPLAMAFAIASGVRPEYGIYTTIIAGFLISLFGGSRFQIAGPTGSFVPILFVLVSQYGYQNLLVIGFMAGVLITLMGVFKLGKLVHFIPRPVTTGFTAGAAVLIFLGQLPAFLGLHNLDTAEEEFIYKFQQLLVNITDVNFYSVITAVICLTATLLVTRFVPRIPGALIGLLCATLTAVLLYPGKVATVGLIPHQLPHIQFPDFSFSKMIDFFIPACVIAMLVGIESLLSAVVADGMSNQKHHSNRELIGQGIANMVTPLFGGIPATGAVARTATNIRNGAVSPVSGMIHSLFVLLVLLVLAPYASVIPLASMAPILMIVSWNMIERKEFAALMKSKSDDSVVFLATLLLTIGFGLVVGISAGLGFAVIFFVIRMGKEFATTVAAPATLYGTSVKKATSFDVQVCTLNGPIFFGSANRINELEHSSFVEFVVLRIAGVSYIDTTGELALHQLSERCEANGKTLIIIEAKGQPIRTIKSMNLFYQVGENAFTNDRQEAMRYFEYLRDDQEGIASQQKLVPSLVK